MLIGNKNFNTKNTYIMGIVNMSTDSFFEQSVFNNVDDALKYTEKIIDAGVDIIDIGGQSTKPGFEEIDISKEIENVQGIISAIKSHFDIPVSVDTYKQQVAKAAIEFGADMVNDIYGLTYDDGEMASLVAENNVSVCIMHNKNVEDSKDVISDIISGLKDSIKIAQDKNIAEDQIIIDPGICFGKTWTQNLEILHRFNEIESELNYPILLGYSNKSFISKAINCDAQNRVYGNFAITAYAAMANVSFIRVHNADKHIDVVRMIKAIKSSGDICE